MNSTENPNRHGMNGPRLIVESFPTLTAERLWSMRKQHFLHAQPEQEKHHG